MYIYKHFKNFFAMQIKNVSNLNKFVSKRINLTVEFGVKRCQDGWVGVGEVVV